MRGDIIKIAGDHGFLHEFDNDISCDDVLNYLKLKDWCELLEKRKTINNRLNVGWLRDFYQHNYGGGIYFKTPILTAAMICCGFDCYKETKSNYYGYFFNVRTPKHPWLKLRGFGR